MSHAAWTGRHWKINEPAQPRVMTTMKMIMPYRNRVYDFLGDSRMREKAIEILTQETPIMMRRE